ncbi:hypothetical protein RRG08_048271 [Elysia crispata]|uniref:Uncharacterized protein n=1 Tax=Elysia crispata TaxID=231223 RepID=A0AAE0ZU98_9GAST|nr:hypothetical protein RRG08_048271 [Elysia crispata]
MDNVPITSYLTLEVENFYLHLPAKMRCFEMPYRSAFASYVSRQRGKGGAVDIDGRFYEYFSVVNKPRCTSQKPRGNLGSTMPRWPSKGISWYIQYLEGSPFKDYASS